MVNVVALLGKVKDTVVEGAKTGFRTLTTDLSKTNPNIKPFVMPISPGPSKVAQVAGSLKSAVTTGWRRLTTNPLAGQTLTGGLKKLTAGTLGVLGSITAFRAGRSAVKGEPFRLLPSKGEAISAVASAYNPFASVPGILTGLGEKYGKKAVDYGKSTIYDTEGKIKEEYSDIRDKMGNINIDYAPDMQRIKELMPDIPQFYPSIPSVTVAPPSIVMPSMSVNAGGGMGGMDMALLALLLGGGAGYLVGRKRKKKRYKKRKRRK